MDACELLRLLKSQVEVDDQSSESRAQMTPLHGDAKDCVARIMIPFDNKIKIFEINARLLCVYEGITI